MKVKNLKIISVVLFAAFAFSTATLVSADGVTKRIKFALGKHAATISGNVIRGDRDTFLLGASEGQTMTVKITSIEKNAVFQIQAPDGSYLQDAGEMDDAMNWTGALPASGDYKIIVGGTRGNASYRLTVSIK